MTIPVTMLAGFLGSGKTTLVRRALGEARERGERIAVVVNEFGDLGIDGELVVRDGGDGSGSIVELAGGCICCEIQEDLRTALLDLARAIERSERRGVRWLRRRKGPIARVLVEASGAASPGAAVQTLLVDGDLAEHMHLDGVVTLTHAALVLGQLAERPEAAQQIAYADRIVVNHADRVPADELERVRAELAALNPLAEVRTATRADVDLGWVLAPRASGAPRSGTHPVHAHTAGLVAVALEDPRRVDRDALRIWLEFLSARRGAELMRAKGILRVPGGAVEVQGIHRWLELQPLAGEEPGASRLVLIGTGLDPDELRRGWEAVLV